MFVKPPGNSAPFVSPLKPRNAPCFALGSPTTVLLFSIPQLRRPSITNNFQITNSTDIFSYNSEIAYDMRISFWEHKGIVRPQRNLVCRAYTQCCDLFPAVECRWRLAGNTPFDLVLPYAARRPPPQHFIFPPQKFSSVKSLCSEKF